MNKKKIIGICGHEIKGITMIDNIDNEKVIYSRHKCPDCEYLEG